VLGHRPASPVIGTVPLPRQQSQLPGDGADSHSDTYVHIPVQNRIAECSSAAFSAWVTVTARLQ
jgi:hypothetical protein